VRSFGGIRRELDPRWRFLPHRGRETEVRTFGGSFCPLRGFNPIRAKGELNIIGTYQNNHMG